MYGFAWWSTVAVLSIACTTDIYARRIPNWLVLPFLGMGIITQVANHGMAGLGRAFAGIAIAVAIFGIPCFFRAMGAGDFKLAAGIAAWLGPGQFLLASVMTAMIGGVMAVGFAVLKGSLVNAVRRTYDIVRFRPAPRPSMGSEAAKSLSIPYAPAIALGTLLSFFGR